MAAAEQIRGAREPAWRKKLFDWLARREYAAAEVQARLQQEGCQSELAAHLIAQCQKQGLIDDNRCAQLRVAAMMQRGYGPEKLKQDLRAKGIDERVIGTALMEHDWEQQARHSLQRRFGNQSPDALKMARYLAGKGFSSETVAAVCGLQDV